MTQLFANNASTTLASAITDLDTSMTVVDPSGFPSALGADDFFLATLEEPSANKRTTTAQKP